jgi:SAM-dependent methyltransferase
LHVSRWDDLPGSFDRRFDLVLCLGNSVSHLPGDAMVEALRGMAGVLADGGLLVVNARNWERLRDRRPRLTFPERMLERGGRRCLPFYIWSFEPEWGVAQRVEIVFLVEADDRVEMRGHEITCWPFRLTELRERLSSAGFRVVADTYQPEEDWYEVVAEKA